MPAEHEHGDVSMNAAGIVEALQEQSEALADGMVERLAGEIKAFSLGERAAVRADIRAHCLASNRLFLDVAASGRGVEPHELVPFMPKPRLIRAGVSLEDVLRAFRLGHMYMWDAILGEARRRGAGAEAALELARRSMDYIDLVSSSVANAYLLAQQSVVAERDRSRSDLLDAVLEGRLPLSGALRAQAAADGLEQGGSYVVIVASPAPDASYGEQRQVVRALHDRIGEICSGALLVERPGEIVGLLVPRDGTLRALLEVLRSSARRLSEDRDIPVSIGMSTTLVSLEAAGLGYREAARAASLATPGDPVVALPFLAVFDYVMATADDTARRIPSIADPLLRDDAISFGRETLNAYLDANLNVRKGAERLGIHANTMHYRLGRISDATGCDLHDFRSLVEILVALRLHEAPFGPSKNPRERCDRATTGRQAIRGVVR